MLQIEHLFYKTPVCKCRLQILKNIQIYCKDIFKSTKMTKNVQIFIFVHFLSFA